MELVAIISALIESPFFWAAIAGLDVFLSKAPIKENNVLEVLLAVVQKLNKSNHDRP